MLLNCGAGEDSWEFLGQQGDQTSQSVGCKIMGTMTEQQQKENAKLAEVGSWGLRKEVVSIM